MKTLKTGIAAGIMAAALALGLGTAARAQLDVPPGTEIPLEFTQDASSKWEHRGDPIDLRVFADVMSDGRVVIPRGAPAEGIVEDVHRGRSFGRKGELKIRLVRVRDEDGDYLPLEPYNTGHRFSAWGPGLLALGPVGVVADLFVKGHDVTIDAGTRVVGVIGR